MTSPASSRGLTAASAAAKAVVIFTAVLNINQVQLLSALVGAKVDVKILFFPFEAHPYRDYYRYGSGRYGVGGSFYGGRYLRNNYGDDYYYGDRGRGSYSMNGYLPGSTRSRWDLDVFPV